MIMSTSDKLRTASLTVASPKLAALLRDSAAEMDALTAQHESDNERIASQAGTTNKLYHLVVELTAQLSECRALLKRCEWTQGALMGCPICFNCAPTHKPDCKLAEMVKEAN